MPREGLISLEISGLRDACPSRLARLLNWWRKTHRDERQDDGREPRSSHARSLHLECVFRPVGWHWTPNAARPYRRRRVSVGLPPGWRHFFCFVFSSPVPSAHSFSVKHGSPQRENVFLTTVVLFYFLPHLSNFFSPVSTTYVCCTRKPHCPPDD